MDGSAAHRGGGPVSNLILAMLSGAALRLAGGVFRPWLLPPRAAEFMLKSVFNVINMAMALFKSVAGFLHISGRPARIYATGDFPFGLEGSVGNRFFRQFGVSSSWPFSSAAPLRAPAMGWVWAALFFEPHRPVTFASSPALISETFGGVNMDPSAGAIRGGCGQGRLRAASREVTRCQTIDRAQVVLRSRPSISGQSSYHSQLHGESWQHHRTMCARMETATRRSWRDAGGMSRRQARRSPLGDPDNTGQPAESSAFRGQGGGSEIIGNPGAAPQNTMRRTGAQRLLAAANLGRVALRQGSPEEEQRAPDPPGPGDLVGHGFFGQRLRAPAWHPEVGLAPASRTSTVAGGWKPDDELSDGARGP